MFFRILVKKTFPFSWAGLCFSFFVLGVSVLFLFFVLGVSVFFCVGRVCVFVVVFFVLGVSVFIYVCFVYYHPSLPASLAETSGGE